MSLWERLLGKNIRRTASELSDRELTRAHREARQVSIEVDNSLHNTGTIPQELAVRHVKAREVETVTRAVGRERTAGNPSGHTDIPESMRAGPKQRNSIFGYVRKRKRGSNN